MKTLILIIGCILILGMNVYAAGCTFTGNGNAIGPWNVAANWSCGRVPMAGDNIFIPKGKTVQILDAIDLDPGLPTFIIIYGTLDFTTSNKLDLATGSGITMATGETGCLSGINGNNSQTINIGGIEAWQSKCNGSFTAPRCAYGCFNVTWGTYPPVLSVNLISFYLEESDNSNVTVHWKTSEEKDFSHFELEKSNENGNWRHVSRIYPNSTGTYSYSDEKSFDRYYRLKMVDLDETYKYSNIISTHDNLDDDQGYIINMDTKILVAKNAESIQILDFNGISVLETTQHEIDLQGLKEGMYILLLKTPDKFYKEKISMR